MSEGKSVRSRRVGSARGVCGVARLGRGVQPRPAPRALHPLPLPANAAHAEYSDRLLIDTDYSSRRTHRAEQTAMAGAVGRRC
jgi:hypothetical protein